MRAVIQRVRHARVTVEGQVIGAIGPGLIVLAGVTDGDTLEDRGWLADIFGPTSDKGIIQHERRHKDHLHVRFYNRRAQEHGRIVYPVLVESGVAPPPTVRHRAKSGETLGCPGSSSTACS